MRSYESMYSIFMVNLFKRTQVSHWLNLLVCYMLSLDIRPCTNLQMCVNGIKEDFKKL